MSDVTKPVVVLFDVDETLVHTGGAGARSWKRGLREDLRRPGRHRQAHLGGRDRPAGGSGDLHRGDGA